MTKVITVMNMKGGVGKTTVSVNISGMLALRQLQGIKAGRKVLVIDYDPQFNLSQALLPASQYFALEKAKKTTLSILLEDNIDLDPYQLQVPGNSTPPSVKSIATPVKIGTHIKGEYALIPSTLDLMYVALGQANTKVKPIRERFEKFINEAKSIYDVIFIDCHPAGSIFTQTSLQNSDHVLIPVMPQRYAVRGVGLMMDFIMAKALSGKKPAPHILFNAVPRYGVTNEELEIRNHNDYGKYCMNGTLKKLKAFSEPEGGKNFVWTSGKPYSGEAFRNLYSVSKELVSLTGV